MFRPTLLILASLSLAFTGLIFSPSAKAQNNALDTVLLRELVALGEAAREGAHIGQIKAPQLTREISKSHLRYLRTRYEKHANNKARWPKGTLPLFAKSADFPLIAKEQNLPDFVPLALNKKAGACVVSDHFTKAAQSLSLYSRVVLKSEQTLVLHTGNRGQLSVFVDDVPVFSAHHSRLGIDQHSVALRLQPGSHIIRFDLRRDQGAQLFARITDTAWREVSVSSVNPSTALKDNAAKPSFEPMPFRSIFDELRAKQQTPRAKTAEAALKIIELYALYEHGPEQKELNAFYSETLRNAMAKATYSPQQLSSFYVALALASDDESKWAYYDLALSIDPKNARAHLEKARALAELSEREALAFYQNARRLDASAATQYEALEFEYFYGNDSWRILLEVERLALQTKAHTLVQWAQQRAADEGLASEPALNRLLYESETRPNPQQVREQRLRQTPHDHAAALDLFRMKHSAGEDTAALVKRRLKAFPFRPEPRALDLEALLLDETMPKDAAREALLIGRAEAALYAFADDARLWTLYQSLRPRGENVDLSTLRQTAPASDARTLGAEILLRQTEISLRQNHRASIENTQVVRVHSPKRLPGLEQVKVHFREGLERVSILEAYVETPEGQRLRPIAQETYAPEGKENGQYLDSASIEITFPPLKEGALMVTRVRIDPVGPQPLGAVFGYMDTLSRTVPTQKYRLQVRAPTSIPLLFSEAVERHDEGALSVSLLEKNNLKAMTPEREQPPFAEMSEVISLTTEASWTEVMHRYRELIGDAFEVTPDLRAYAKTLAPENASVNEKVDAAFKAVTQGTRYVGIEFGLYGFKPHPAESVWRQGFGDCKDKSGLLIALLSALGVEANIVLLRTRSAGVVEGAVPSLWHFNHAIVYVPALDAFMDPTLYLAHKDELPVEDRGAQYLIISDEDAANLERLPEDAGAKTLTHSITHARFGPEGALEIEGEESLEGAFAPDLRTFMRSGSGRDENFERVVADALPGFALESFSPKEGGGGAGYVFSGRVSHFYDAEAGAQRVPRSLFREDLRARYALEVQRERAVALGPRRAHRQETYFYNSENMKVTASLAKRVVSNKHFIFTQELRVIAGGKGVLVLEELDILSERVDPADYPTFQKDVAEVDALQTQSLSLSRQREAGL